MAFDPLPAMGSVTLTNGQSIVSGTNTGFRNLKKGDQILLIASGDLAYVELDPISNLQFTLPSPWPHATQTDVAYRIIRRSENAIVLDRAREFLELFATGYAVGFTYSFVSSISAGSPGVGRLAFNNENVADATKIYLSDLTSQGVDIGAVLNRVGSGAIIQVRSVDTTSMIAYFALDVSASATDHHVLSVRCEAGNPAFASDEKLAVVLSPSGTGLDYDAHVEDVAARAAYDEQQVGYRVLISDIGDGRSGVYTLISPHATNPIWNGPAFVTGPPGPESSPRVAVCIFDPGRPGAGEVMWRGAFDVPVAFPENFDGPNAKSLAGVAQAPAADAVFSLSRNGVPFATITFAAGNTTGSFSAAATNFAAGDVLALTAPSPRDAALGQIYLTLAGSR